MTNGFYQSGARSFVPDFGRVIDANEGLYKSGYDDGYRAGFSDGKQASESEGYDRGYSAGYDVGKLEGREAGYAEGYEAGYAKGYADGEQAGYEKGRTDGKTEGYAEGRSDGEIAATEAAEAANAVILADCNEALSNKGADPADFLERVPQRIGEIDQRGCVLYASTLRFNNLNLFGKKEIEIHIPNVTDVSNMFVPTVANDTVEHITLVGGDVPTIGSAGSMFNMNWAGGSLKHITFNVDFSKMQFAYPGLFNYHSAITTIDGKPLDFSSCMDSPLHFYYMDQLQYIRFVPLSIKKDMHFGWSDKLSADSIQSIIDGLADLTGATAQTLTFHATVGAKLTQAQKDAISAKNWTLVY